MSHEFKRQARKKLNIVCLYFEDTHEKVYLNDAGNIINPLKQQSLKSQFSLPSSASNELKSNTVQVIQAISNQTIFYSQPLQSFDKNTYFKMPSSNSSPPLQQNIGGFVYFPKPYFPIPILKS